MQLLGLFDVNVKVSKRTSVSEHMLTMATSSDSNQMIMILDITMIIQPGSTSAFCIRWLDECDITQPNRPLFRLKNVPYVCVLG